MLSDRQKISFFLPLLDIIFFILIAIFNSFFTYNTFHFIIGLFTFIFLLNILNFYSDNTRGRTKFFLSCMTFILLYDTIIILLQYSFFDQSNIQKFRLLRVDAAFMVYFFFRLLIVKRMLKNTVRYIYVIKNEHSAELENLIIEKTNQLKNWIYQGASGAKQICDTLKSQNSDNNIVLISKLSHYNEDDQKIILELKIYGYLIHTYANFSEIYLNRIPVENINDEWLILSKGFDNIFQSNYTRIKRVSDIVLAVIGLVLSSPLTIMAALAIKLDSKGPIIFSQIRSGKNGKPFTIYKLRTMRQDAEKDGAKWAAKDDNRITPVGDFLRKTRVDEIPQMYNVLRGDMSFIGPRPERPEFDEELAKEIPYYMLRYLIKPGLTGWAQVNYGYGASVEDAKMKLKYDLYYIKNYSFYLDMVIVLRTILIVLFRKGR
ncbi:exopolysaccharide biosynthesis polyprenyl glycosylphosphotransferase [Seleniivibrio woodruffii]|uniref:exopolysaccharide biosynthesis polyprenyl glycosylphosphotransferase n=1 Tax=Seleniivibrio woodruffii TaxID=1078050 RepID=UPI0026E9FF6B|nr:exopolysaccharide biosynthesis polyprenyl glycosylphosphotransferase [Seleniivibrio woodruffii]